MEAEIRAKFPNWIDDDGYYDLCLTDDIDSLFSCLLLENIKHWKINYFYDFKALYRNKSSPNQAIGVDLDLVEGKTFGNHVTFFNPQSANLNTIAGIKRENYTEKYALSTLLMIMSLYDIDISQFNEEQLMTILSIDSAYLGFYNSYFRKYFEYWVSILEYPFLFDFLEKHRPEEFEIIKRKYRLNEKIKINKKTGILETSINLAGLSELFSMPFYLAQLDFTPIHFFNVNDNTENDFCQIDNVFSLAFTGKNKVKYSTFRG
ncbi:MAG TPA: hypothetical protein GXX41_02000 [Thermoanaerobacterium sp.]|nr:hypothetical protein [Thermoanaerobacterium sp.]